MGGADGCPLWKGLHLGEHFSLLVVVLRTMRVEGKHSTSKLHFVMVIVKPESRNF